MKPNCSSERYALECGDLSPLFRGGTCHAAPGDKSPGEKAVTSPRTPNGRLVFVALLAVLFLYGCATSPDSSSRFTPLFPQNGIPAGWRVGAWNDVSKPGPSNVVWRVTNGVLQPEGDRGSWLMSEKEYGDFILEYEFKLGETGNSGLALRAPMKGDPAFDGMELQMADFRYNPKAKDSELTGGLYRALAPTRQLYKPTEWNSYRVELRGPRIVVILNGEKIQDADLNTQTNTVLRHDNSLAVALKDRPRRGHLGFQELSRGQIPHVMIRNARIQELGR